MLMNALTLGCMLVHRQQRHITTTEKEHDYKRSTRRNCLHTKQGWYAAGEGQVSDGIAHEKDSAWVRAVCDAHHAKRRAVRVSCALQSRRILYMIKMRLESRAAFTKANACAFLGLGRLVSLGAVGLRVARSPTRVKESLGSLLPRRRE